MKMTRQQCEGVAARCAHGAAVVSHVSRDRYPGDEALPERQRQRAGDQTHCCTDARACGSDPSGTPYTGHSLSYHRLKRRTGGSEVFPIEPCDRQCVLCHSHH